MCFTGGFALAMMVHDSVALVLAQPSVPSATPSPPEDLETVKQRAAAG